jgi:hypothetical protein
VRLRLRLHLHLHLVPYTSVLVSSMDQRSGRIGTHSSARCSIVDQGRRRRDASIELVWIQ